MEPYETVSPNALISLILPNYELFIEFEFHGVNKGQQNLIVA